MRSCLPRFASAAADARREGEGRRLTRGGPLLHNNQRGVEQGCDSRHNEMPRVPTPVRRVSLLAFRCGECDPRRGWARISMETEEAPWFPRPRGAAPHGPGGIAKRWNHSTGTWENAAPAPEIPSAPPAHPAVARLIPRPRGAVCCENAANSLILPCAARARARAKTPRSRLRDIFPFIMRPLIPVQSHLFAPFLLLRSPLTMTLGGQCSGTLT